MTWRELQGHASFPAADTEVAPERLHLPIGTVDTLRYTVERDGETDVFWFSPQHPGMPVRFSSGGVTVTVVADEVS